MSWLFTAAAASTAAASERPAVIIQSGKKSTDRLD